MSVELSSIDFFPSYNTEKGFGESFTVTPCGAKNTQVFEPERGSLPLSCHKGDDLNKSQSEDKFI